MIKSNRKLVYQIRKDWIKMQKIISFDIWDTIIKRKCHPEEVKLATARYIILKYENKLKD